MRTSLFITLLLLVASIPAAAQSTYTAHLRRAEAGKGTVIINQSSEIEQLVNNSLPARPVAKQTDKPHTPPVQENHATQSAPHHATTSQPVERVRHSAPAEHSTTTHTAASQNNNSTEPHTHINRMRHKARGYRISIFTGGNTRADRTKAMQMGQKCRELFPELASYTSFSAPRWVTHVGDFKTREEAQKYVRLIRRARFTYEVRIVSSEVNIPY